MGGGPAIGLYDSEQWPGSAIVWECTFGNYSAMQRDVELNGDVKVENERCRVLSDLEAVPAVFDEELMEEIGPWWLRERVAGDVLDEEDPRVDGDLFEDLTGSRAFLLETDDVLARIVMHQAVVWCLPLLPPNWKESAGSALQRALCLISMILGTHACAGAGGLHGV